MAGIRIIGLGKATGDRSVTNEEMSQMVDTSDQWIREKSGIQSRFFAENRSNADMAVEAAQKAIADAGVKREQIGWVFVCTFTPDNYTPSVACAVTGRLGLAEEVMALDVNGACTGFIYGCKLAEGILASASIAEKESRTGVKKYALVIGSEKISDFMDMKDRSTCVLFGDGAGAALLEYSEECEFTFYGGCQSREEILHCKRGAKIHMAGQEVYRFAVSKVPACIEEILRRSGHSPDEIDWFVCHQANERIIDNGARRLADQKQKFYKNLYHYGNTSAASIPIALSDMAEEGFLTDRKKVICTGFGAGLTFGSMLIEIKR